LLGEDFYGQMGNGSTRVTLVAPSGLGGLNFSSLQGRHRYVRVAFDRKGYCWGNNFGGQLGSDTPDSGSAMPVAVLAT